MRQIRFSFARSTLALVLTAGLGAAAVPAGAEELGTPTFKVPDGKPAARSKAKEGAKAAAKPGGPRRAGELEGWDKDAKAISATAGKSRRPVDAIGERAVPDGGLPLPERRFTDSPGMGQAPVQIDQNGRMGGAFRF